MLIPFFSRLSNSQSLLLVCASLTRHKVLEILWKYWSAIPSLKHLHIRKWEEEETQLERAISTLPVACLDINQLKSGKSTPGEVSVQGCRFYIFAISRNLLTAHFLSKSLYGRVLWRLEYVVAHRLNFNWGIHLLAFFSYLERHRKAFALWQLDYGHLGIGKSWKTGLSKCR